ncbi:unnamed protein product [marine sediment metagenome]|uniref:Uncharacterized protein n=1 Tax=marine sediment metagenome TaxID=412755 RepID=X1TGZ2_9ZZZZ
MSAITIRLIRPPDIEKRNEGVKRLPTTNAPKMDLSPATIRPALKPRR